MPPTGDAIQLTFVVESTPAQVTDNGVAAYATGEIAKASIELMLKARSRDFMTSFK